MSDILVEMGTIEWEVLTQTAVFTRLLWSKCLLGKVCLVG